MQFTGSRYIVAGVSLLIAYIAISSQVFVFIPWLYSISLQRALQVLIPFNLGVFFIGWNYYLACTTDPGTTPPGWGIPEAAEKKSKGLINGVKSAGPTETLSESRAEGHSTAIHHQLQQKVKENDGRSHDNDDGNDDNDNGNGNGNDNDNDNDNDDSTLVQKTKSKKKKNPLPRYCRTCEAFKPPRSHHCRICKRCVLKMDHHCPWINNCVGYHNYGHFIRFITWVTLTTGMCMVLLVWRIVDAIQNEIYYLYTGTGPTKTQIIFMAINIAVDGGVLLAVGILTIYHLWSMITNTSTIEVWEQEKVQAMIKKGKLRMTKFPYDVGCYRNYRQVLGPRMWLWLWPQKMLGSGTEFDVMDDKDAAMIWPPREYQTSKKQNQAFVSEYTTSSIRQRRKRNLSSLGTPLSPSDDINNDNFITQTTTSTAISTITKKRRSEGGGGGHKRRPSKSLAAHPQYPTHVRRGSEGWIVQDLTLQQRAELFDRQLQYQREHGDDLQNGGEEDEGENEEAEYQEGLSDIEGNTYGGLPGGMQGNPDDYNYYEGYDVADEDEALQQHVSSSEEDDDLPYDVISDEYDDDGYNDETYYRGHDDLDHDDLDEHNPYLAYADEDNEEQDEGITADIEDEVTLNGRDRHKIGRFFENMNPTSIHNQVGSEDEEIDEWSEGEGLDVGCRPPTTGISGLGRVNGEPSVRYDPTKKTFFTMLVEREEALKRQQKIAKTGKR